MAETHFRKFEQGKQKTESMCYKSKTFYNKSGLLATGQNEDWV